MNDAKGGLLLLLNLFTHCLLQPHHWALANGVPQSTFAKAQPTMRIEPGTSLAQQEQFSRERAQCTHKKKNLNVSTRPPWLRAGAPSTHGQAVGRAVSRFDCLRSRQRCPGDGSKRYKTHSLVQPQHRFSRGLRPATISREGAVSQPCTAWMLGVGGWRLEGAGCRVRVLPCENLRENERPSMNRLLSLPSPPPGRRGDSFFGSFLWAALSESLWAAIFWR